MDRIRNNVDKTVTNSHPYHLRERTPTLPRLKGNSSFRFESKGFATLPVSDGAMVFDSAVHTFVELVSPSQHDVFHLPSAAPQAAYDPFDWMDVGGPQEMDDEYAPLNDHELGQDVGNHGSNQGGGQGDSDDGSSSSSVSMSESDQDLAILNREDRREELLDEITQFMHQLSEANDSDYEEGSSASSSDDDDERVFESLVQNRPGRVPKLTSDANEGPSSSSDIEQANSSGSSSGDADEEEEMASFIVRDHEVEESHEPSSNELDWE